MFLWVPFEARLAVDDDSHVCVLSLQLLFELQQVGGIT